MPLFSVKPTAIPALEAARRRRWWWLVSILLVCGLGVVALRPMYRWGKKWRARALAAQAEELMAAKSWQDAIDKTQAAFQLAPGEPATLRAFAHLYTRAGAVGAMEFWKKLLAAPGATIDDRRQAVEAAIQFGRIAFAEEQLAALSRAEPTARRTLELAARLAVRKGDRDEALETLGKLLVLYPDDSPALLLRAELLFTAQNAAQRIEGRRGLLALARNPRTAAGAADAQISNATALQALIILAEDRDLPADQARWVAEALEGHPEATIQHRLAALAVRIRLEPGQREALLDAAVAELSPGGVEALLALGRWSIQQGEPARALEIIPLPVALGRQELFLVRLDALAALGRWAELRTLLEKEKVPLERFHQEIFLARAGQELDEARAAEVHWSRALLAAGQLPQSLLYLAQYAEKVRRPEIAVRAYRQLARNSSWALAANAALLPLLEAQGDTRGLREVMKQLVRLAPADPAPRNDLAYLDLLLNENVAEARHAAEGLVAEWGDLLSYRTTLALACLRAGDAAAAQQVYEGQAIRWEEAPPAWQAVHAAVRAANGDRATAEALTKTIPESALKAEERALLENWK